VLPLVPPEDTYWSPYSGLDALCGNPLMIDIEDLVTRGLLDPKDLPDTVPLSFLPAPAQSADDRSTART
jgi:4-alpha-glucanotransferase